MGIKEATFHANLRCYCRQFLMQQQRNRRRRYRTQTNTELQTDVGMIIAVVDGDGGTDNHCTGSRYLMLSFFAGCMEAGSIVLYCISLSSFIF